MIEYEDEKYKVFDTHTHWSRLMRKCLRPILELLSTNDILDYTYGNWKLLKKTSHNKTEMKIKAYVSLMDYYGIDKAINLPVFQLDVDFSHQCELLYPERIIGFGGCKPLWKEKKLDERLEYLKQEGFKGIKLHAQYNKFNVKLHKSEITKVLKFLEDEKMVALFHSGTHFYIKNLTPIVKQFDDLTVILGHMGLGPQVDQALVCAIQNPQVYLETSGQGYQYLIRYAIKHTDIGVERVLYGSDLPTLDPHIEMTKILTLPLNYDEKKKIFWDNSYNLF